MDWACPIQSLVLLSKSHSLGVVDSLVKKNYSQPFPKYFSLTKLEKVMGLRISGMRNSLKAAALHENLTTLIFHEY